MKQAKFNFRRRDQCTHAENLQRVRSQIAPLILAFFRRRKPGSVFHLSALTVQCLAKCPTLAPDSPRRVLCALRNDGLLGYRCLSRRDSLYRVEFVPDKQETPANGRTLASAQPSTQRVSNGQMPKA